MWEPCKSIPIFLVPYRLIVPFIWNFEPFFGSSTTTALVSSILTLIVPDSGKVTSPETPLRVKKFLTLLFTVFTS